MNVAKYGARGTPRNTHPRRRRRGAASPCVTADDYTGGSRTRVRFSTRIRYFNRACRMSQIGAMRIPTLFPCGTFLPEEG